MVFGLPLNRMRGVTGFTLIEVLVSMVLLVILSAMVYSGLMAVLRSTQHAENHLKRLEALQLAFYQVGQDVLQATTRPVRDGGEIFPAFKGGTSSGILLECTRSGWFNPTGLPRSILQRVSYEYTGDSLVRIYTRVLDRAPDSKLVRRTLLTGVRNITFRFMGEDGEFHEVWPLETEVQKALVSLPKAVEISLEVEGLGEFKRIYQTIAAHA